MSPFSPEYDNKIAKKYSSKTLAQKLENKLALQAQLNVPEDAKQCILCVPRGLESEGVAKLLLELLPGAQALGVHIVLVGQAERSIAESFSNQAKEYKHILSVLEPNEDNLRLMYAAADASLFLERAKDTEELHCAMRYAAVPILSEQDELENYNAIQETGNAFTYSNAGVWHVFAAMVRAKETFQFPYDYRTLQRHCMEDAKEE